MKTAEEIIKIIEDEIKDYETAIEKADAMKLDSVSDSTYERKIALKEVLKKIEGV